MILDTKTPRSKNWLAFKGRSRKFSMEVHENTIKSGGKVNKAQTYKKCMPLYEYIKK